MSIADDPTDLEGHEQGAADEQKVAQRKRQQQIDDVKWLMGHVGGRRIVTRLLEESGVFRTSFHTSGSVMSFNEGKKHVGYFLTAELLEHTPDQYLKLLKEYTHE